MAKATIIGYGNPLRGDDGLGWHAAQRLGLELCGPDMRIITCHQLTPELAEPVSQAALAIFIDADQQGPPGTLTCRRLAPALPLPGALSHHLTPSVLLACAQAVYSACPEAYLLSVAGAFFGYGEELSPAVKAALPGVIAHVRAFVLAYGRQERSRP